MAALAVGTSFSTTATALPLCKLFSTVHLPGVFQRSKRPTSIHADSKQCKVRASSEVIQIQEADLKLIRREAFLAAMFTTIAASGVVNKDTAEAASTSRRALKGEKVPESEYKTLPNGLRYYDLKVGGGAIASKGSRVAVHYVVKWRGVTFMTSRQGLGVTGGTPYGFDVGASEQGIVLKGLDYGVQGMRVGGQRLLIVPPELAYGNKGIQEIPPNATLEMNLELLSIKQSPFGSPVKLVEG
ncbi:hypothetical protein GOP47_0012409 [Adiantum capillus-veneris]|uniref:peptidylprolyl isomerase n=1 Tax=Adiantum capillus-veneris TaxID=13818 RepID=A0A9D4US02_ADICA|nr:hypothetical protein GOP47_0012409 [Adiantum capillus-veneris]